MNILFVVENYPPHLGGAEIIFKNTCELLVKKGHKVTVVTHRIKGTPKKEVMNGVHIERVPCAGSRYLFTFIAPFYALKHAKKADIIHTTTYNGAPPAWLVAKLTQKPVVITVHETWVGHWKEYTNMSAFKATLHDMLERPIWKLPFTKYMCVSNSTKKQLEGVLAKKYHKNILVNHNGFDYAPWLKKTKTTKTKAIRRKLKLEKNFVVFAHGRPGVSKGFTYLAQAFAHIKKDIPNAHLVLMLSQGKAYAKERKRIETILEPCKKDVTFLTSVNYDLLPEHLAMANCIVVPSLCEGFGYTTIEANASGIPLVASAAGSIPEVISGKYVLVEPKNPQSIAKGIQQVYEKKYIQKPLKKYTWEKNISTLLNLYTQVKKNQ